MSTIGGYIDTRIADLEAENARLRGQSDDRARRIESLQSQMREDRARHSQETLRLNGEIARLQRQIDRLAGRCR